MRAIQAFFNWEVSTSWHSRFLYGTGHLGFLVLGILSLVYYKERMLHFDTANYAFHMMYYGDFFTGHERYISYIPQVIPLLFFKSGASLAAILMSYSFSFILINYLIYLLITYLFKNPAGGVMLLLSLILTIRFKFYAPVGEVVVGIAFAMLILGWISSPLYQNEQNRWLKILLAIGLSSIMLIGHPFPMISLGICWLIYMVYSGRWKKLYEYFLPLSWVIMWSIKLGSRGVGSSYENERANRLLEAWDVLNNLQDYYVWDLFIYYVNAHYTLTLVLFALILIYLLFKKRWLSVLVSSLGFIIITALVLILHAYLNLDIFFLIDGYLTHLGVVMAMVFTLALAKQKKVWAMAVIVLLVGFSLDRIKGVHEFFTGREQILLGIIDNHSEPEDTRLLAHMDAYNWDKLWYPWPISIETLMMTKLRDPEHPQTLYFLQYDRYWDKQMAKPDFFLSLHYKPLMFESKKFPPQLALPDGYYKRIDIKGKY